MADKKKNNQQQTIAGKERTDQYLLKHVKGLFN